MDKNVIRHIEQVLKDTNIGNYSIDENEITIYSNYLSGLLLHISVKKTFIDFYYSVRTSSWTHSGERTDIHDVISTAFSYFLKFADNKISCSLINVVSPAVSGLEDEVYARYIVPIQYDLPDYKNIEEVKVFCEKLILAIFAFDDLFWGLAFQLNAEIKAEEINFSFELSDNFNNSIKDYFDKQTSLNIGVRNFPCWEYASDIKKGLSIIKSNELAFYFSIFAESLNDNIFLNGINGKLLITKEYKNFISNTSINYVIPIFKKLNDNLKYIFPLENKIICVGQLITVFLDSFCDFQSFKNEKAVIKQRHLIESKLLFPPENIIWMDRINDDRFELLIKVLLERQDDVNWIRRVGHIYEADGGRDLIAEWSVKPIGKEIRLRGENINKIKRIIVQCKAYKKGVGKSDVTYIRDIIEHNDCDGYFLVVSSYLKRSLTEHLEKMRYSGKYWIDWWTRDEIEKKLLTNMDIANKFPDIVKIKY